MKQERQYEDEEQDISCNNSRHDSGNNSDEYRVFDVLWKVC
ncbi:hypothetical protein SDC9_132399 [bioreactor metagenome]|uniref:Uncharacterized protein n=1 Tax=bioreactor metagenome TaxID=1076179 RepID=A0A645D7T4_9ZZZZ